MPVGPTHLFRDGGLPDVQDVGDVFLRDVSGPLPSDVSIDGLAFDSTETAWSVYGGWQLRRWVALELGYSDLGNSGDESIVAIFNGPPAVALLGRWSLGIEEWHLGTRFSAPLWRNLSADAMIGVTRVQFDAGGALPVLVGFDPVDVIGIPFVSPEDETGLTWGVGLQWETHERLLVGIEYRQHDTQVLDVETLSLGATSLIH